jgi:hypothetical protein
MSHPTTLNNTAITGPQYPPAGTNTVNRALTPKRPRPGGRERRLRRVRPPHPDRLRPPHRRRRHRLPVPAHRPGRDIDTAIGQAVTGLRAFGYSWADIGARLGITRQAAQQRRGAQSS